MKTRLKKLYEELEFLLNNAPTVEDCTDAENKMYSDMAKLKESTADAGYDKVDEKSKILSWADNGARKAAKIK